MEVTNKTPQSIDIDAFQLEYLAFAEPESPGGGDPSKFRLPNIHIESDYACGGEFTERETDITEKWVADPEYTSQRNYPLLTPCILDVSPKLGPDYTLAAGQEFKSFSVYEMPFDSDDRERKGLFKRRFHYTVAPWLRRIRSSCTLPLPIRMLFVPLSINALPLDTRWLSSALDPD